MIRQVHRRLAKQSSVYQEAELVTDSSTVHEFNKKET